MRYLDVNQVVDYTGKSRSSVKEFFKKIREGGFTGQIEANELKAAYRFIEWRKGSTKMEVSQGFINNHFPFKKKRKTMKEEMSDFKDNELSISQVKIKSLERENARLDKQNEHLNHQIESYLEKEKEVILLCRRLQEEVAALKQENNIMLLELQAGTTGRTEAKKPIDITDNEVIEEAIVVDQPVNVQQFDQQKTYTDRPEPEDIQSLTDRRQELINKKIEDAVKENMSFGDWMDLTSQDSAL